MARLLVPQRKNPRQPGRLPSASGALKLWEAPRALGSSCTEWGTIRFPKSRAPTADLMAPPGSIYPLTPI